MLDGVFEAEVAANDGLVEGTPVMTLKGPVAVQDLRPGDRVVTRAGALALVAVDRRMLARARLVRVSESALGRDRPEADMWVAADQPILVRDWRAKAMAGSDRAMIPAVRLADGEYIRAEARRDVAVHALRFAVPTVVYAGGLEFGCDAVAVPA